MSAQCTDKRVNVTTPALFARFRRAADYAGANRAELEELEAARHAHEDAEPRGETREVAGDVEPDRILERIDQTSIAKDDPLDQENKIH